MTNPDAPLNPEPTSPPPLPAVFDPNLFPPRHRPLRQLLADHNPFLLLSTVCMLLGCYLVNSALREQNGNSRIVALLAVINVYEACIIPLGLILIRRTRGIARDGWWLLLFEMLFLVNATFINVDFGPWWSIPFNLTLLVLACVKAGAVLRGLKIRLSMRTLGFLILQLAIIYGLPILFAQVKVDGRVSSRIMYGLWWLVGMLPVAYDLLARFDDNRRGATQWDLVQNVIRRVYLIAPWVMLVAHMGFAHWAHHADFVLADLTPIFFGLAVASLRLKLNPSLRSFTRILPAAGLLLTFLGSGELKWGLDFAETSRIILPAHFAIAGMVLTYGYMATIFQFLCALASMTLIGLGYIFQTWILTALLKSARFLVNLLPDTVLSWGVTAISVAFVLLGIGSYLSLRRTQAAKFNPSP